MRKLNFTLTNAEQINLTETETASLVKMYAVKGEVKRKAEKLKKPRSFQSPPNQNQHYSVAPKRKGRNNPLSLVSKNAGSQSKRNEQHY